MPLTTFAEEVPNWREGRSAVLEKLGRGEIPTFVAAEFCNTSLSDLTLLPAIVNGSESDPRRRSTIPAFSGKRPPVPCDPSGKAGVDATALLTLGFLNVLDEGLDAFDTVYLPHSTLRWLFHEEQRAPFHQPSRLADARRVGELLDLSRIMALEPTAEVDRDLAAQVGNDLAMLIAEAEKDDFPTTQRVVVRPGPVHRAGTLMDEEVDLASHHAVLSGCRAVVDVLRKGGLLPDEKFRAATSYLSLNDPPWPEQPAIDPAAHLYLDDLALTYFLHCGVLGLLHDAGFTVFITPSAESEAAAMRAYEGLSAGVRKILERIRRTVAQRIADGRVRIGPIRLPEESGRRMKSHPTLELLYLTGRCDVLISDDRYINSLHRIGGDGQFAATASTLDVLDTLEATGAISTADRLVHRTRLRRAGYLFVPVTKAETLRYLEKASMQDGRVIETARRRAVRESVLVARMGYCLQFPDEARWLTDLTGAFLAALGDAWRDVADVSQARAWSDWILDQVDLRGWLHRLPSEGGLGSMEGARAGQLVRLLLAPPDVPSTVREHYHEWVEDRLLRSIRTGDSDLYSWLAETFRVHVSRVADKAAREVWVTDE